jgi:hypothetical protein
MACAFDIVVAFIYPKVRMLRAAARHRIAIATKCGVNVPNETENNSNTPMMNATTTSAAMMNLIPFPPSIP